MNLQRTFLGKLLSKNQSSFTAWSLIWLWSLTDCDHWLTDPDALSLKGIIPQKNLSPKPHTLDSNRGWPEQNELYQVKLVSVGRAKKPPGFKENVLKVCSLGPQGDPHMRPWGNPQWSVRVASRSYRGMPRGPCGLPRGLIASITAPHYYPKYEAFL